MFLCVYLYVFECDFVFFGLPLTKRGSRLACKRHKQVIKLYTESSGATTTQIALYGTRIFVFVVRYLEFYLLRMFTVLARGDYQKSTW